MNSDKVVCFAIVIVLCAAAQACATAQASEKKQTTAQEVEGSPPAEPPPDDMPPSPPVKVRDDLPEEVGSGNESEESNASSPKEPEPEDGSDQESAKEPPGDEKETADEAKGVVVTESALDELLKMGPAYVFQVVMLEPDRKDGEFRGFRILEASEEAKSVMSPQIEVGDVVTHVNDVRLERPDDYMKAWKKLDDVDVIEVDLLRDGDEKQATWTVK